MKDKPDLVRAWLKKAASDLVAMRATAQAGSLDTACFHAQQAAEKHLKAYLLDRGQTIPHTHNLYKLIAECSRLDPAFNQLVDAADVLNPFAVEVRYDTEFWPTSVMFEDAEAATNRVAQFIIPRLQSAVVDTSAEWKAARNKFDWKVNLRDFKHAAKYPGFFDRVIIPDQVSQFEELFRTALASRGPLERAGEVLFWKNYGTFQSRDKIAADVLARLGQPLAWEEFAGAVENLATTPTWACFKTLIDACGMKYGFAGPITFLSFYDPQQFPMADKRIAEWWSRKLSNQPQFRMNGSVIALRERSWIAYLSWAEFCQRQAAELSKLGEMTWRARDVEMAVWTDTEAQLPLNE